MNINKENRTGEIRLSAGHALILGNKPPVLELEKIIDKLNQEPGTIVTRFGLFDTSSPNYTTYYPEVTEKDLNPVDIDFIQPVYRLLSEVIVSKGVPIDFSKPGVLKESMPLLLGQTINIDHGIAVGNAIGAISEVFWQNSYKDSTGYIIPAGINGVLKIDGKSNPRIARGIMMSPPSIHSNSVTVRFSWEPSHTFEKQSEFYEKLGTYDKDGKLIRLVVNKIKGYLETSLVSHGADAFAQKIGADGKIVNPHMSKTMYSFSADKPIVGASWLDYKGGWHRLSMDRTNIKPEEDEETILGDNNNTTTGDNKYNNKIKEMEELLKNLSQVLELPEEEVTQENIIDKVKEKLSLSAEENKQGEEITQLQENLTAKEEEVKTLKDQITELTKNGELLDTILNKQRTEAIRLFKLCKGEEADENILKLISTANLETSIAFVKQYTKEADEKYPQTCKSCNSTDISRSSALTSKEGIQGEEGDNNQAEEKGLGEVRKALQLKGKRRSLFLGNLED